MHVSVDLGFRNSAISVCVLVAVIGFFIARHKWRRAAARSEEIRRLLALAAEEAARAEFEVTAGYDVVSAPVRREPYCAVCYLPTTTRCARCKAVRYCSGKCQIIHWRQGHRENCQPGRIVDPNIDGENNEGQKVTKIDLETDAGNFEARQSTEILSKEPEISNPGCPPEVQCVKDDDDSEDEYLADRKETNSPAGSSATSFSGFSNSTSGSGSSDDVSVSESVSSFEPDRADAHQTANDSIDMLHNSFNLEQIDQSGPLSPKFASLVDSVDGFAKLCKSNQVQPSCNNEDNAQISISSSGVNHNGTNKGPATKSCTTTSDFWGSALDSFESEGDDHVSSSCIASKSKISPSGSSSHTSFESSTATPLHTGDSESTSSISDDALSDTSGPYKSINGAELLEKTSGDVSKFRNSPSLNLKGSHNDDSEPRSTSPAINFRETKPKSSSLSYGLKSLSNESISVKDALHSSKVVPTSSERSNHIANSCSRTLKSNVADCQSSSVSDACFVSGGRGSSVLSVKSGNGHPVEDSDTVSSQVTKSSNEKTGSKTSVFKVFDQFRGTKISKHYPVGVESDIAGKHAEKELFPYEVFVKLYNWNKVELHPSGLINCGNSCYANAVLQCLAFTPPLTSYLLQGLHSNSCAKKEWCFMCEFEMLILKAKEGKSPLSPIGILSQLRSIGSQLGNGREEDAHEFLRYAIDTMQSVCLMESGVNASRSLKEETTLIGLTFGGYLRSKIKCSRCQGKSEQQERMMDLTVEIEGDIGTLEEALRRFTGTEVLDGENKYQCSRCKSYEKAKKKLTILEAPNVLTIALKRFQSGKFGKINKPIRFPEILDLAPYMSGTSDKSPIYKLYGVVVHLDVMNAAFSGHYVCYVKNLQNKWFKIDDSTVTAVELENVLAKGAYMLLYSRCSARAPRLIRNRIISSDPKQRAIPSWFGGKSTNMKSKSFSTLPNGAQSPTSCPPESSTGYPPLQRISEEDSSSDNSSLISSCSDEGSSSTESTRYSTSTDDFSDYIFGDSGRGWNSPWRNFSDSDSSSSSSSPLSLKHSPLSDSNRYASNLCETGGVWDGRVTEVSHRFADSDGTGSGRFLNSDITKQCRKLASNSSSSSSVRGTDSERLGVHSVSNVRLRKSNCERTAGP
ncbi:ubiquitin carboxyl-terminal hydrolase 17-like [Argentina anserina]|uniref:ubiquitin carboxyl-terminal hydrolase 17-like n=1 Tax=Argentina anserina TaxID=57926 RepID=UPI0021766819|nr:ubiquitin carboxyl-terminal hydrolase 17-like [Potentilla anserina]